MEFRTPSTLPRLTARVLSRLSLFFAISTTIAGCGSIESVAPWERGYLAEAGMQWDASAQEARFKSHTYTSKESSSGGNGAAGGGCGCN